MSNEYAPDDALAGELRELREQVRQEAGEPGFRLTRQQEEGYLYGDRDLQLFPQLQQHLRELASLYVIQERPFTSGLPLVGPLIAWFRDRWNRISTKWYVQPLLEQQVRFNAAVLTVLQDMYDVHRLSSLDLARRTDAMFASLDQGQAAMVAQLRDVSARLDHCHEYLAERVRELQQATGEMGWQVKEAVEEQRQLTHQQALDRRAMTFLQANLERLMSLVLDGRELTTREREDLEQRRESLEDYEYYRFEERYRPEATVQQEQRIYLPFYEGRRNVVDLGCGKGEFLELLRSEGIEAYGVDLNEPMVQACQEKGLLAFRADALEHLVGLPDDSLGGLFAAHLIEHLPTKGLIRLIQLALAKLEPGAYLILETPNPLCLWALVHYFYMDLSHDRPVHPHTLSFLLEMHGFREVEVRPLHPVPEGVPLELLSEEVEGNDAERIALLNRNMERLNDLLYGYADYAVIAQK